MRHNADSRTLPGNLGSRAATVRPALRWSLFLPGLLGAASLCFAEKVLMYDEQRGIVFVDKDANGTIVPTPEETPKPKPLQPQTLAPVAPPPKVKAAPSRDDIQVGRKKDPPELYFKSGLEYFKNNDYVNALKNFNYAFNIAPDPSFLLWIGKTYRQIGRDDTAMTIMQRIYEKYPQSDVADDALFEIAFYYQRTDEYEHANQYYAWLAEQYPYGLSYSSGDEFLVMSREQRSNMRAEIISTLSVLGIQSDDIGDAYRKFQKKNGLAVTGTGTGETVRLIKKRYQEKQQSDALASESAEREKKALLWSAVATGVLAVNLGALLLLRARIRARRKQVVSLIATINELDIRNL